MQMLELSIQNSILQYFFLTDSVAGAYTRFWYGVQNKEWKQKCLGKLAQVFEDKEVQFHPRDLPLCSKLSIQNEILAIIFLYALWQTLNSE